MQQFVLQYVQVALGQEWPRFFFLFGGTKFTHAQYIKDNVGIRFDMAEIRGLNRQDQSNV